jgi:hypothetical protein
MQDKFKLGNKNDIGSKSMLHSMVNFCLVKSITAPMAARSVMSKKCVEELQSLSYAKPFGEGAFIGWKRVAFINGLI